MKTPGRQKLCLHTPDFIKSKMTSTVRYTILWIALTKQKHSQLQTGAYIASEMQPDLRDVK